MTLATYEAPAEIELDAPLVLGASLAVTLNGASFSGEVEQIQAGVIGATIKVDVETIQIVTAEGQGSFFFASSEPAVIGENTLKIVQYES